MTVANPIFLWCLAGLAIPLTIHLLSRKEGKIVKLGSIRHVQESSTRQFRGIRLNEILLLVLRSALIVVFTLILSGLLFPGARSTKWVVVEKGLEAQPRVTAAIDSLEADGYEARWLATDFPRLKDSIRAERINYRSLAAQLGRENISGAIVFAINKAESFAGIRSSVAGNVRWISQPTPGTSYPLQAFLVSKDSVTLRRMYTDANATTFEYVPGSVKDSVVQQPVVTIELIADSKYQLEKRIIVAALKALKGQVPVIISIRESPDQSLVADWQIRLSDQNVSAGQAPNTIVLQAGAEPDLLVRTGASSWRITKRLNEYNAIKGSLALKLGAIIFPGRDRLEQNSSSRDRRMMPDSVAWSPVAETRTAGVMPEPMETFLLVIFLMILFTERLVAYRRNQ
jgi:hypothetical protein